MLMTIARQSLDSEPMVARVSFRMLLISSEPPQTLKIRLCGDRQQQQQHAIIGQGELISNNSAYETQESQCTQSMKQGDSDSNPLPEMRLGFEATVGSERSEVSLIL